MRICHVYIQFGNGQDLVQVIMQFFSYICPLILLGHANKQLAGNLHLKAPDGTPMANAMLSIMHTLGMSDVQSFGDSTTPFNLQAHS
jgi:hypothetical protein